MLSSPKGTHDLMPEALATWRHVEQAACRLFERAGFHEIRTPLFEATELFERGVGEATDIVNKEMYTFQKGDRSLTLRPENTAGVVRAYIQHGMDRWPKPVKLYYMGPMFRYERPQAGRQRQFHQIGVELFGLDTPQADAAVIQLAMDLFEQLGLQDLCLEVNNVGCFTCREAFREQFKAAVAPELGKLCEDCQKRYHTNPLRMLDCKNPACKTIFSSAHIAALLDVDNTCEACRQHFNQLCGILEQLEVPYKRNKMLVRGLDYYTRTVFEITSGRLGAQNAVCGGGRYNNLVKTLGGPDTPAVGWALGVERLVSLVAPCHPEPVEYYVASDDPAAALQLARDIRRYGFSAEADLTGKKLGKQIDQANKLKAVQVIILGESERAEGTVTVKTMATGEQDSLKREDFFHQLHCSHLAPPRMVEPVPEW